MATEINVEKSKAKMRVVTRGISFWQILDIPFYFIPVAFAYTMGTKIYKAAQHGPVNGKDLYFLLFWLAVSVFCGFSLLVMNRLTAVGGLSQTQNRRLVKQVAKSRRWTVRHDSPEYAVYFRESRHGMFDDGKEITIIYTENYLLINVASFGRGNTKSPFHYFGNKWFLNRFLKELKQGWAAQSQPV